MRADSLAVKRTRECARAERGMGHLPTPAIAPLFRHLAGSPVHPATPLALSPTRGKLVCTFDVVRCIGATGPSCQCTVDRGVLSVSDFSGLAVVLASAWYGPCNTFAEVSMAKLGAREERRGEYGLPQSFSSHVSRRCSALRGPRAVPVPASSTRALLSWPLGLPSSASRHLRPPACCSRDVNRYGARRCRRLSHPAL